MVIGYALIHRLLQRQTEDEMGNSVHGGLLAQEAAFALQNYPWAIDCQPFKSQSLVAPGEACGELHADGEICTRLSSGGGQSEALIDEPKFRCQPHLAAEQPACLFFSFGGASSMCCK